MALTSPAFDADEDDSPLLSAINTTPLVDVMLVLLIIFLITIPVVTTSVPVSLPRQTVQPRQTTPRTIQISVDAQGRTYWFDHPVASFAELRQRLQTVAQEDAHPVIHIRGDQRAAYAPIGRIVYACQLAGIANVAFITEPEARD